MAETLREQFDESGRRIDQVREDGTAAWTACSGRWPKPCASSSTRAAGALTRCGRTAPAGLDDLQRQVAETLREQFDERAAGALTRCVRTAPPGLDNLQRQVAETLREQFEVTGQRIDETREHLLRVEADMAVVIEQLDRERYTVFKPLLRRAYRLGAVVAMRLPGPVRRLLQRLKRRRLQGRWPCG